MALFSTLADLKDAVRDECERGGHARFDAALPRFVAGAEQRMWYGAEAPFPSEPVRLRAMEEEATITVTDGAGELPADYLSARRLIWTAGEPDTAPLYEAPDVFHTRRYALTTGHPVRYTIEGDSLLISPQITSEIKLLYYARPDALEDETDTNGVLTSHPMLYFHATLIEAYRWLRNAEKGQEAFGNYTSTVSGLLNSERRARQGGNQLAMRIPNWRAR